MPKRRRLTSAQRKTAVMQLNDTLRIERAGRIAFQKVATEFKRLAHKYQHRFEVKTTELVVFHKTLRDILVAAHLQGLSRARNSAGMLQLETVQQITARFRKSMNADYDAIVAKYDAATANVVSNLTTKLNDGIRDALQEAVDSEVSPRVAVTSFFSKEGLTNDNFYFFETILRTQTQIAYNAARYSEYQRPEIDEILWGYTYVTVGDDRVRPEHVAVDGTTLPKDHPFWRAWFPPNGWNCRCQVIPQFEKVEDTDVPDVEPDEGFGFNPDDLIKLVR